MSRRPLAAFAFAAFAFAALAFASPTPRDGASAPGTAPERMLTVFAASSLTDAFSELGRLLEQRRAGLRVRFNFAGSQQLVAQLQQGAAADVFASADQRWMRTAVDGRLVTGEPQIFARNRLVVLVPVSNPGRIQRLQDLARPGLKLVLAGESVPAGKYSREVLGKLGAAQGFPVGFAGRALANLASEEENVKAVVAKVQLGEADAGMAYWSDVTPAVASRVRVLEIPEDRNIFAEYPIAVVRDAADSTAARAFVELVLSAEGRRILERHGLLPGPVPVASPRPR
jgi:molybdate transport system substrate-binding protein